MKILTLNLHCYAEEDVLKKQQIIAQTIIEHQIDVILLQEVAQTEQKQILFDEIKEDNYGYLLQQMLLSKGYQYDYYYQTGNRSFGIYDEGLAILSKHKLLDKRKFYVSKKINYDDWSTRLIVGAQINLEDITVSFTSAHLGWSDGQEVFEDQVDKLFSNLKKNEIHILGGDFNVPAGSKEHQYLMSKGYQDIFYNEEKDYFNTPTHKDNIDEKKGSSRIDYLFTNHPYILKSREILFQKFPVSDHYGVLVEIVFI
ncbi:MAG: endonuclease/exonuclease/phosphatase family protein [Firmicutes bacterium]|nr:endonuclease/exonuclease/phosphatase family protein [Bacillota bacterium]